MEGMRRKVGVKSGKSPNPREIFCSKFVEQNFPKNLYDFFQNIFEKSFSDSVSPDITSPMKIIKPHRES